MGIACRLFLHADAPLQLFLARNVSRDVCAVWTGGAAYTLGAAKRDTSAPPS